MEIEQILWTDKGWSLITPCKLGEKAQLVLVFFSSKLVSGNELKPIGELSRLYPNAYIFGCSTAGEIQSDGVFDESIAATAIFFEDTKFVYTNTKIKDMTESFRSGEILAKSIEHENLVHVFVLSDGLSVNGSELVRGLTNNLPSHVTITGGLAGDGPDFKKTYIYCDSQPESNKIGIIGFYGKKLKVGYGSLGGWDPFGPERIVTSSNGNILYELDGRSALDLYKTYLGEYAKDLPAMGLLFPLSIRTKNSDEAIVRTILAIREEDKGMVFAGDVPEGSYARFMKANVERLIDGSHFAANICLNALDNIEPQLTILISCVGRKLVLKQRIEEEVEAVRDVLGKNSALTGFYSYGEIAPFKPGAPCRLHNQTMTITSFSEG